MPVSTTLATLLPCSAVALAAGATTRRTSALTRILLAAGSRKRQPAGGEEHGVSNPELTMAFHMLLTMAVEHNSLTRLRLALEHAQPRRRPLYKANTHSDPASVSNWLREQSDSGAGFHWPMEAGGRHKCKKQVKQMRRLRTASPGS
jgi:hypothetical protein